MQINCKIVLDILLKPPEFHTTAREPKREQLMAPAFNHTTKIPRETTREREKILVIRPDPMLHFARFLSTPFELNALNSILLFTSIWSKLQFFSCFELSFFDKVSESNSMLHFGSFLSRQTKKLKPYNQPLEPPH